MLPQPGEGAFLLLERFVSLLPQRRPRSSGCGYLRLPFAGIPQGIQLDEAPAGHPSLCCSPWRGSRREVRPQDPRMLRSLSLRAAQQRFPGAQRSLEASPARMEMQLWVSGTGWKIGNLHPLRARFMLDLSLLPPYSGCRC